MGFDAANYRWQNLLEVRAGEPAVRRDRRVSRRRRRTPRRAARPICSGCRRWPTRSPHVEGRQVVPQWSDERRVDTLERYVPQARRTVVRAPAPARHALLRVPSGGHATSPAETQGSTRGTARFARPDGHVRRLFEALERSGRLDRTIVVISSDHGSQWKSTGRVPAHHAVPGRVASRSACRRTSSSPMSRPRCCGYLGVDGAGVDGRRLAARPVRRSGPAVSSGSRKFCAGKAPAGLRLLLDSGPPNYGAAAAMVVDGDRWFDLRLATGTLTSGRVPGHTRPGSSVLAESSARAAILEVLGKAGFKVAAGFDSRSRDRLDNKSSATSDINCQFAGPDAFCRQTLSRRQASKYLQTRRLSMATGTG